MSTTTFDQLVKQPLQACHIDISEQQQHSLQIFAQQLQTFGHSLGLTALSDQDMWVKHFLDSLCVLPVLPKHIKTVLDIGSGAGFPGLCLATMLPHVHFTLAERRQKKASFLRLTAAMMGLTNVTIHANDIKTYHQPCDLCVFRAVTMVDAQVARQFLRHAPLALAYKGQASTTQK